MHSLAKCDSHIHIGWALVSPELSLEREKGRTGCENLCGVQFPVLLMISSWGQGNSQLSRYSMPESPVKRLPKEVSPWKEGAAASLCHGDVPCEDTNVAL